MKHGLVVFLLVAAAHLCLGVETQQFVYRTTVGQDQVLKVYYPDGWNATKRLPCVLFFHGGGWVGGDLAQFDKACAYFAARGMVAITANYRMWNEAELAALPPGESKKRICVMDGKSAIRWVKSNAAFLGIDAERIVGGGNSAGGHIVTLSFLDEEFNHPDDNLSITTDMLALMLYSPAFTKLENDSVPDVNAFAKLDTKPLPPTLFFDSDDDGWKPAADALAGEIRARGYQTKYWNAMDQGHVFWANEPWFSHTMMHSEALITSLGLLPVE